MKEPTTPWRLLVVPPRSGSENMARDAGLLDRARVTGEAVFSVYQWLNPTLSLGRNQTACGMYDLGAIERRGIDVVRRPTGGRALIHNREVTYSVTAPIAEGESLGAAYRRINRILLEALRDIGVEASEAAEDDPMAPPGTLPCFASPSVGELVTSGAKLVGSAQFRERGALLQHGSILIHDDQAMIAELILSREHDESVPAAATLARALGRDPSFNEVAAALFEAVKRLEDTSASTIDESATAAFTAAHIEKYRSELWTWRR